MKFAILVLALGCLPSTTASVDRQVDDIREATYRYMFGEPSERDNMYCLSIYEKDPSDELMVRFAGNQPPVIKHSKCAPLEKANDPLPRKPSPILFSTYYVDRPSETRAEVLGSYYKNGLNASETLFYLELADGRWKVVKAVVRSIS